LHFCIPSIGAFRGALVCAATEAAAGGNPRGVEGAAPYNRVSYCLLPIAYCLNFAFCILHFAFRQSVRVAGGHWPPLRSVHRGFCLIDAPSRKMVYGFLKFFFENNSRTRQKKQELPRGKLLP
jgi:hypothetical protein